MDLMNLAARLTLDMKDYEDAIGKAGKSAQSFSKNFGGAIGKVGSAIKTVAKVGAVAIGAGATAVGFLTKQAVEGYAQYEQLSGGVKKLFGDAADDVIKFANEAYKTSGMSANQYMEQATGFAASLINSLGGDTKKAAELADVAMRAMSDNVNTFGTDMGSVQYAFQGFAKQNYTMLDNLKLGYGGTKSEMQRLIADAAAAKDAQEKLGLSVDGTSMSFDNIVKAIQVVQYEQGIAGTTAKEAATTIEGAFNMTKAAWENLVAGLANPDADLGALMDNLIVSIVGDKKGEGLLNQLLPAVERALQGIGQFVQKAAPIISQYLPGLMSAILPGLLSAATSLVIGLAKALPSLIAIVIQQIPSIVAQIKNAVIEAAPALIEGGKNLMKSIYDGLTQAFPQIKPVLDSLGKIFETAFKAIGKVVDFFKQHFETIKTVVVAVGGAIAGIGLVGIIGSIAGAIGTVVGAIGGLISALSMIKSFAGLVSVITTLAGGPLVLIPALIGAIVAAVIYLWNTSEGFRSFVTGLWETIQSIVAGAIEVLTNLGAAFAAIWQDVVNSATAAWDTITSVVSSAVEAVSNVITTIFEAIKSFIASAWQEIQTVTTTIWNAILSVITTVINAVKSVIDTVFNAIKTLITTIWDAIKSYIQTTLTNIQNIVTTIWNAIKTVITTVINAIQTVITTVWNAIKTVITTVLTAINTVITTIWNAIKTYIQTTLTNLQNIITTVWNAIKTAVSTVLDAIKNVVSNVWNAIKTTISNAINAVKTTIGNGFTAAKDKVSTIVTGIKDKISTAFTAAKDKVSTVVGNIKDKISDGFTSAKDKVTSLFDSIKTKIKGAMDSAKEAVSSAVEKIKSKMHFSWSLPHLKMPHISISGKFSLNPPSAPHFSIDWYKKAMDTPWLFTSPTVIPAMGFGDAGSEIVYGKDSLMRDIREAQNSGRIEELLAQILTRLNQMETTIMLDGARVSASVDRRLGTTVQFKERGVI